MTEAGVLKGPTRVASLSNQRFGVNYWMMADPAQPKPADILAAVLQFRKVAAVG